MRASPGGARLLQQAAQQAARPALFRRNRSALPVAPPISAAANAAFFLFKLFVVLFFSVTLVRISVARFRITQVVDVYWKVLGALSIVGLILVMVDAQIR